MKEVQVEVINEKGLHARPSTRVAQIAMKYSSSILLKNGPVEADAKSVISLMMLAVVQGTTLTVTVDGPDEEEALADIIALVERGFDDD